MHKALGKGLGALIPIGSIEPRGKVEEIDIESIFPNKYQSRINFDEKGLNELADSIKERGLIQPIIVCPTEKGRYQLVAGERRLRASKLAGFKRIPAIVRNVQDRELFEYSLIENIQREDLNPLEEAGAYERLMEEFGLTQEELAQRLGKKRSSVANIVRLLNLPTEIRDSISKEEISSGHARAILSIKDDNRKKMIAQKIIRERLTVREAEKLTSSFSQSVSKKSKRKQSSQSPEIKEIEEKLQKILGTKVEIKLASKKRDKIQGSLDIQFYSQSDLERIIDIIMGSGLHS